MKVRTSGLKGFALVALSAFAFAACEDKTVIEPTPDDVEVSVTPSSLTLNVGQTGTLVAITSNVPTGQNQGVTWRTSTPAVATVSATGVVTAVAPGNAVITAISIADTTARDAAAVIVNANPSTVTLQLVPATAGVQVGGTVQLVSIVGGSTNQAVTYRSSAPGVATVSSTGLVTGVSAGTAVITALATADTINGRGTSVITVSTTPPPVVAISLTPTQASVGVGGTQQFLATVTGSTNTGVTWRTSDPAIATISSTGLATGVGQGTAIITAIANADTTKRQQATLTVVGASVAISSVPASPAAGNFVIQTNVQVPAGTADSLVIRLTSTTGQTFQVRCQTFTAAGATTLVNCPINPADIDPNTPGAQILPNGTYTIQAVLLRANQVAATATFGQQLTTTNANTVAGTVTFDNSLVDGDNAADADRDVDGAGNVWFGGAATVMLTPSVFTGPAVATADVVVDLNCNGIDDGAGEPSRSVTVTNGTGSVTFSEASSMTATTPGIDNLSQLGVCFAVINVRDAQGVPTQLAGAAGTGNVITTGTVINAVPGSTGQNQFNIDNVEPPAAAAALTFDPADFDGLGTAAFLSGARTISTSTTATTAAGGSTVLNPAAADAGVDRETFIFYAVPIDAFNAAADLRAATTAAGALAFTSSTTLAETTASSGAGSYVLVVETRDALGNRRFAGGAPGAPQVTFGVDNTAPTISVVEASSAPNGSINPAIMSVRFAVNDANSGAEGIRGTFEGRSVFEIDADAGEESRCYSLTGALVSTSGSGSACTATQTNTVVVATVNVTEEHYDVTIPGVENFYTLTVSAFDAAGNVSTTTITRTMLLDVTAGPDVATGVAPVTVSNFSIDNTNNTATVNGVVRDNIEVASADARFLFTGLVSSNAVDVPDAVPFTASQTVGSYGLPLTAQQTVSATTSVNVDAVYPVPVTVAGGTPATQFGFGMTDLAGNFIFGGIPFTAGTTDGFQAGFTSFTMSANPTTIDRTPPAGGSVTTTLMAQAVTAPGDPNPFAGGQIYFYYVNPGGDNAYGTADDSNVLIGQVPAGTVAVATGETARTYTWSQALSATNLPVLPAGFALNVFAIGVAPDGDAVMTTVSTVTVNQ